MEFQRKGETIKALDDKPELKENLQIVYEALTEIIALDGAISTNGITAWLDRNEIYSQEEKRWFFKMILSLYQKKFEIEKGEQEKHNG